MSSPADKNERSGGVWQLWNQALARKMAAGGADLQGQAQLLAHAGEEARQRGDNQALWAALNGLSKVCLAQEQVAEAKVLAQEALVLAEELFGPEAGETGTVLSDLVFIEALQGQVSLALVLAKKLETIVLQQVEEPFSQAFSYNLSSLATFHTMRGEEPLTERIFWQIIYRGESSTETDPDLLLYLYKSLGDFYHAQGQAEKEEKLLQRALAVMERAGYPRQGSGHGGDGGMLH